MAIKKISFDDYRFIHEVIGPQLQKNRITKISTNGGANYDIDYCIINSGDPHSFIDVIVLLTGFGSGWTDISKLAYDFAKLDYQVCMLSLPGYGNSSDPHLPSYLIKTKRNDVEVLDKFIKKILSGRRIHLVGHSMGAEIITRFASFHPENIAGLTLLNPAGFEKRGMLEVAMKFTINGIKHRLAFRGNPVWKELKKFLPKEKGSFTFDRLEQRLNEWHHLCKGEAVESLNKIPLNIPIKYITGEYDFVYPYKKSAIIKACRSSSKNIDIVPSCCNTTYHNTTMHRSEKTAKMIHKFICKIKPK